MDRKTKDKYLQKKYGRGIDWYEERAKNGCEICGSPPKTRGLHTDHSHKMSAIKTVSRKEKKGVWWAYSTNSQAHINLGEFCGRTKSEALRQVKKAAKPLAVRGTLCFGCNGGLRKFRDNPVFLRKAAEYLERYEKELSVK